MKIVTINKQLISKGLVELANAAMHKRDIAAKLGCPNSAKRCQDDVDALLARVKEMRDAKQVIVICE